MVKHKYRDIKNLFDLFVHDPFPNLFNQLNPARRKRIYIFPYLGEENSKYILAFKNIAMHGLKKETKTEQLVKNFRKLDRDKQKFVVYNLSHELKIASLAASIALNKKNSNVYEIGPCFGFSSLHFSHLIKEKGIDTKSISKLIAIEIKKEFVNEARNIKKMTGDYVGDIEYIHEDGINYLRNKLKKDDVVFSSIATPFMLDGILDLIILTPINLIVSYSEHANEKLMEIRGKYFIDLIDNNTYDLFPFGDNETNLHLPGITPKIGLLALPV